MKKFEIDYYTTIPSKIDNTHDGYEIIDKTWMKIYSSANELTDNFDIFVDKKDLKTGEIPTKRDFIFFIKEMRFFEIMDVQDAGDYYIANVVKLKCK